MDKTDELKVFISGRASVCDECHESLLLKGFDRFDAREAVRGNVQSIMDRWQ